MPCAAVAAHRQHLFKRIGLIMKIKKILFGLIAPLSVFALVLSGCGVYSDAVESPGSSAGSGGSSSSGSSTSSGGYTSTVSIVTAEEDEDGETVYVPYTDTDGITAQWMSLNVSSVQTAEFNSSHYASLSGLDGEYQVTISGLDDDYSYNTNAYSVSNDSRKVVIVIYEVTIPRATSSKQGTSLSYAYSISDMGIYRATIASADDAVWFKFSPTQSGSFSLTSWENAAEDLVDPVLTAYFGSSAWVNMNNAVTVDTGGTSGIFTTNFLYQTNFSSDMVGGTCVFTISARSYTGNYPVTVDFCLAYDGDYVVSTVDERVIVPEEEFEQAPEGNGELTLVYAETGYSDGVSYAVLDEDLVGLNQEDGYYHLLDENGQPNGPLLYAYISSASPIYGTAIINVEDSGNNNLTVYADSNDRRDYALMLQGYDLAYSKWLSSVKANNPNLSDAEIEANRTPGDGSYLGYEDVKGYNDYVNSDGMYPVTEELKEFFQLFAEAQLLFMDGNGWVEGQVFNGYHYDAYDDSMWLFACAYYA